MRDRVPVSVVRLRAAGARRAGAREARGPGLRRHGPGDGPYDGAMNDRARTGTAGIVGALLLDLASWWCSPSSAGPATPRDSTPRASGPRPGRSSPASGWGGSRRRVAASARGLADRGAGVGRDARRRHAAAPRVGPGRAAGVRHRGGRHARRPAHRLAGRRRAHRATVAAPPVRRRTRRESDRVALRRTARHRRPGDPLARDRRQPLRPRERARRTAPQGVGVARRDHRQRAALHGVPRRRRSTPRTR